jgi:endonuclease YncB( thermonuclease family)
MAWLFFGLACPGLAKEPSSVYVGKAVKVSDGDTITLETRDFERVRVRFYGIDAPEKSQPGGPQAMEALRDLIANREVAVEEVDTDRYSRVVGLVRVNGQLLNLAMVEGGWAWLYPDYCRLADLCPAIAKAEKKAKSQAAGLWAEPNPIPPWRWRKGERPKLMGKGAPQ